MTALINMKSPRDAELRATQKRLLDRYLRGSKRRASGSTWLAWSVVFGGIGAMGPYNAANATIGRAYGLLSQNLQGGSVVGDTYMGSIGNAYNYACTWAENEERSPWEPLHVQKGFDAQTSTVTIFHGCRSTTFCLGLRKDFWREHVKDMLLGTDSITAPVLVLDPITARQFVERGGFDTKAKLIRWLHETAEWGLRPKPAR